jgi:dihydrolipoamide dehydrogenase
MLYDLIVLGGGPAGYLASERAGEAGLSVLLIEERSVGGVCLNEGCIPTKTLLYSAKLYDGAAHGDKYGVSAEGLALDHGKVIERKNKVVRTLVAGVKAALKAANVTVVSARGTIAGKTGEGFAVQAGGETHYGKRLLIATGSSSAQPPIPGLAEAFSSGFALTSRELLDLREVPPRLAVVGGGVIGLELASYFRSAGSEVTIVEMLDHIAGENDPDLVKILQKNYEKKGIRFLLSTKVTAFGENAVHCEKDGEAIVIEADCALISIGRRANAANIGLETIGVATERGAIVTDVHMRTNVLGVYAAGDVNGRSMLAHTAYREAEVAVNDMLGIPDEMRYDAIPAVIYTNPELASAGETEYTARAKGMEVASVALPMRYSGRYLAENEGGDGMMKLVCEAGTGRVIGAQALANYASEFIAEVSTLIALGADKDAIRRIVFPHPTVCEIIREAAWKI